jgi:hypothetical protein
MRPIQIPEQSEEQLKALAELYRTTHNVRLRTRAQMVSASRRTTHDRSGDCGDCARK